MLIYTAITGNYDKLKEQPELSEGLQFEAFLDREQGSRTWKTRPATSLFPNPSLNAKYHKILSHLNFPDNKFTLWIDGSIEISAKASVLDLAEHYLSGSDMAVFAHDRRYCLYQEAAHCIHRRKDDSKVIQRQVFRYTQEGYPANNGLAECTILLRRNNSRVKDFNELWWNEILTGSIRDQISFPYVAWKTGINVNYMPRELFKYTNEKDVTFGSWPKSQAFQPNLSKHSPGATHIAEASPDSVVDASLFLRQRHLRKGGC